MSMDRSQWMRRAACVDVDPELFFNSDNTTTQRLRDMCNRECPVLELCRPYAILHEEFGFWAGLTEKERARHRRRPEDRNSLGLAAAKNQTLEEHNLLSPTDRKLYQDLSKPAAPRVNQTKPLEEIRQNLLMSMQVDLDFDLKFEI